MGILDKAKAALGGAKEKAADLAHDHGDKITGAIDKAGDLVDKTTKGKYAGKIDAAQAKAKDAVVKLGEGEGHAGSGDAGSGDAGEGGGEVKGEADGPSDGAPPQGTA